MEEETKELSQRNSSVPLLQEADSPKSLPRRKSLNYKSPLTFWTVGRFFIFILILIFERTCFLGMLYSNSNVWIVLSIISGSNTIYSWVYTKLAKKTHKIALYKDFKLSRTPAISLFIVVFIGYSFVNYRFVDMVGTLIYWGGFSKSNNLNAVGLFHMTIAINCVINLVLSKFK